MFVFANVRTRKSIGGRWQCTTTLSHIGRPLGYSTLRNTDVFTGVTRCMAANLLACLSRHQLAQRTQRRLQSATNCKDEYRKKKKFQRRMKTTQTKAVKKIY